MGTERSTWSKGQGRRRAQGRLTDLGYVYIKCSHHSQNPGCLIGLRCLSAAAEECHALARRVLYDLIQPTTQAKSCLSEHTVGWSWDIIGLNGVATSLCTLLDPRRPQWASEWAKRHMSRRPK